ncbi:MAG: hypothetical protein ACI9VR_000267 [Cognaticolwellia sp.]|jgi:hypothetical protein
MIMLNLLALLACAKDVLSDSAPPMETDDPAAEDQLPVVFIEASDFVFGELVTIQVSGTATDRQTPDDLEVSWISDIDGVVGSAKPVFGFVSLRDPDLSVGTHVLTLRATDPDGNVGEAQATLRRNARPLPPEIILTPEAPTDKDTLSVEILEFGMDPDGGPVDVEYTWFRNDVEQPFDTAELPATATGGAETWRVNVSSVDSVEAGVPAVASVFIGNNPPGTPGVILSPELVAGGAEPLQCVVETAAPEPDGQALTYRVVWTVDGLSYPADFLDAEGPESVKWPADTIPLSDTSLGELWSCEVWASDGLDEGPGSTAYATAVAFESYGLTTVQDYSDSLQAGLIIVVPVRIKESGTAFAARLNTVTAEGEVRMALYTNSSGRPGDLLLQGDSQALVEGVNTVAMTETAVLEDGWYYLCFVFSETEQLTFKQSAYLDSGYVGRDYSLPWDNPMYNKPTNIEALFNAWILVK